MNNCTYFIIITLGRGGGGLDLFIHTNHIVVASILSNNNFWQKSMIVADWFYYFIQSEISS